MSASRRWQAGLAIAAFVAGLIAFAPASLIDSLLLRRLAPSLTLQNAGGSLWAGSGTLIVAQPPLSLPLSWHFDAGALLRLRLGLRLQMDSAALKGSVTVSRGFSALEARDADITADWALLEKWQPALALAHGRGTLHLTVAEADRLEILPGEALPLRGRFNLAVSDLTLPLWHPGVLGSYSARVDAGDGAAQFALTQSSGLLHIEGSGSLRAQPTREFAFTGAAAPTRPGTSLGSALAALGRAGDGGRVVIDRRGAW